jgi:CheY-like chemotaxis protein
MDLWMPEMDGYQATEKILNMFQNHTLDDRDGVENGHLAAPVVLAVSADVTDEAIDRATKTGMEGFMTKPYKLMDLQKLIVEFCIKSDGITGRD